MPKYREVPMTPEFREGEKIPETKVFLHFFRHEEKEARGPEQSDIDVKLTKKGKEKAIKGGLEKPAQPEVAWAAGSERIRAAHTALIRMAADKGEINPEMDFEEAKGEVEKELKYGKKVAHLPELNFYWEGTPEFEEKGMSAYKEGRGLDFLLNESDDLVRELKDQGSLSYSRVAANYASLIAREMIVGNNFNKVVAKKPDKYKEYGDQLERYLGTHGTVSECFYMKVLEKLFGIKKSEEFIETFRDEQGKADGFDFQEGFEITISNGPEGQKVVLEGVKGFDDIELTPELLQSIISDAEELDKSISEAA